MFCKKTKKNKIKKLIRHRMKRIQSKLHRIGLVMFAKFVCLLLMIKDTH